MAADSADWAEVSATRPLLSGDKLRTGENGFLLAELGNHGAVGLYGNAEVAARGADEATTVDVSKGKVAFHLGDSSPLTIAAAGTSISSDGSADGYIEVAAGRQPTVTAEVGNLVVNTQGTERRIEAGQRLNLETNTIEPVKVAGAYGEKEVEDDAPAPPPPPPPPAAPAAASSAAAGGLSAGAIIGWTALAVVTAAVVYAVVDDDDDDDDASPSE